MAKVHNQVYDGSEETYTDQAGDVHYFGETVRQTMTDGYPIPTDDQDEVVRKSPRGYKPTEQGAGSEAQRPWRECFAQCAEQWNGLPDECAETPSCPERSSKKNVFDAKQGQGVMCSYYDLFMGCCLSSCVQLTITGPDGVSETGGFIPGDSGCWPCPSPCKVSQLSISYYTTSMVCGESQELAAQDSEFGDQVPCCPAGDLSWEIISGGGSLQPTSGLSVIYTAPASNAGCSSNPTIKLTDCCGRVAELALGVSTPGLDEGAHAFQTFFGYSNECLLDANCPGPACTCEPPMCQIENCWIHSMIFNCIGGVSMDDCTMGNQSAYCVSWDTCKGEIPVSGCYATGPWNFNALLDASPVDLRSDAQIEAGCCPAGVL